MKKSFYLLLTTFIFISCQHSKPQVFGLYIDGTFEEFMEQARGYHFPITIDTNRIQHISEKEIVMQAYSLEVIDMDEEIIETDTINIHIPISDYNAIRASFNRIYGSCNYYDISEYSHACCWMIGKDCLWLTYTISEKQTKYTYIIN